MAKKAIIYEPQTCGDCGQTTTYAWPINKGMSDMLYAFANAVTIAGKNDLKMLDLVVDPKLADWRDPMHRIRMGRITYNQYGNRIHVRRHGLIARVGQNRFCLTKKGAAYLRGESVEAAAVIDKRTHQNIGYVADPNGVTYMTTVREVYKSPEGYWSGWDLDIMPDGTLQRMERQPTLV